MDKIYYMVGEQHHILKSCKVTNIRKVSDDEKINDVDIYLITYIDRYGVIGGVLVGNKRTGVKIGGIRIMADSDGYMDMFKVKTCLYNRKMMKVLDNL